MSSEEMRDETFWKLMLKKHWLKLVPFVIAIVFVFIGGVLVFLKYIELEGYATWYFNDWSIWRIIVFLFWFCIWELLIVGLPSLAFFGILAGIMWYLLPEEDRAEIKEVRKKEEEKKKKPLAKKSAQGGGGGISVLITIIFLIKVALDGNFDTTFGNLPLIYFVNTTLFAIFWIAVVGGPIALIVFIIWFRKFISD
jgi:hypothetical protein